MTRQRKDGIPQPTDWTRQVTELPSSIYSLIDVDLVVYRHFPRDVQVIMLIEQKAFNATIRFAQKETYSVLDQMLSRSSGCIIRMWNGQLAKMYYAGWHILTFDGRTPQESDCILWDGKQVAFSGLIELMAFKRDPQFAKQKKA